MFKLSGKVSSPSLDLTHPLLIGLHGLDPLPAPEPCTEQDVRTVLDQFALGDLQRLNQAFDRGLVVRRSFSAPGGRGCLLYHLDNAIVSFGGQTQRFGNDTPAHRSSQRLIAGWDSERLTEKEVRRILAESIAARDTPSVRGGPARTWSWRWVGNTVAGLCAKAAADAKLTGKSRQSKTSPARKRPAKLSVGVNRKPAVV
jgi:hypothetical protein